MANKRLVTIFQPLVIASICVLHAHKNVYFKRCVSSFTPAASASSLNASKAKSADFHCSALMQLPALEPNVCQYGQ